jgi:hypothetical protein
MNIGMGGRSKVVGVAGVVAISLSLSLPAAAQQPPAAGDGPPETGSAPPEPVIQQRAPMRAPISPDDIAPSFATLDRQDAATRFGVQVGFSKLDRVAIDDAFFMRFDLYGQYVIPDSKIGIYAQLPISRGFVSDTVGESTTAIGNFDVGVYGMPTGGNDLILRAGLMLGTASDGANDLATNSVTAYERLTDLPLAAPNLTMLRLSASTVQQRDMLFFRADLGLDLVIDQDRNSDQDIYGRLNVAGGVRLPAVDVSLELATYGVLDGPEQPSLSARFLHTGAIALRSRGTHQFHAGFVTPLDDELRGEIWILSLGYQRAL